MDEPALPADDALADGEPGGGDVAVGSWLLELGRVPLGLLDARLPTGRGVPARTREQLILTVTEARGGSVSAWVHGTWLDFLGHRDPDEALEPLFAYARSCADAGHPLDTTTLDAVYPPRVVRAVRATVAHASLGAVASAAADRMVGRARSLLRRRAPEGGLTAAVADAGVTAVSVPLSLSLVAVAAAMRVANALAPDLPDVELPDGEEADLAVHLLAEAVPTYLGNTVLRTLALLSPMPVAIAVRLEDATATLHIGQGRVGVTRGTGPDALLVIEGGSEPLLQVVAASILHDLGSGRPLRRNR